MCIRDSSNAYPPSISKNGKLRLPADKSEMVTDIFEKMVAPVDVKDLKDLDANVIDGSMLMKSLDPKLFKQKIPKHSKNTRIWSLFRISTASWIIVKDVTLFSMFILRQLVCPTKPNKGKTEGLETLWSLVKKNIPSYRLEIIFACRSKQDCIIRILSRLCKKPQHPRKVNPLSSPGSLISYHLKVLLVSLHAIMKMQTREYFYIVKTCMSVDRDPFSSQLMTLISLF